MQECVPVLAFHGFVSEDLKACISEYAENKWIDDIEGFEHQMRYLHDNGWTTLTMDEFYAWYRGKLEIPEKSCVLTFDDGYYEMYYLVYPILKKYDFNGTCFVIGKYTPGKTAEYDPGNRAMIGWDKIKQLKSEYPGMEFESHSYNLHGFDEKGNESWVSATKIQLTDDFAANQQLYDFKYMAYPYGGYNDLMLDIIEHSDIRMAFTFKNTGYATKHKPVFEIPRQKITGETGYEEFVEILEKTL